MRNLVFLLPILVVCALLAFIASRVFDATPASAPAPATPVVGGAAGTARAVAPSPPASQLAPASASPTESTSPAAPEPEAPPAARMRQELEARLHGSGATREAWAHEAGDAVAQVLRAPELQAALRNAPTVECFAEGCMAKLVFASQSDFDLHQPVLGEASALGSWSRVVTGPERQPDGSVQNALVVFRPPSERELAAIEAKRAELDSSRP